MLYTDTFTCNVISHYRWTCSGTHLLWSKQALLTPMIPLLLCWGILRGEGSTKESQHVICTYACVLIYIEGGKERVTRSSQEERLVVEQAHCGEPLFPEH